MYEAMARVVCGTRWRDIPNLRRYSAKLEQKYGVDIKLRLNKLRWRMPLVEIVVLGHMESVRVSLIALRSLDTRPEHDKPPVTTATYPSQER